MYEKLGHAEVTQVEVGAGDTAHAAMRAFADKYFAQFRKTPFGMMRLVWTPPPLPAATPPLRRRLPLRRHSLHFEASVEHPPRLALRHSPARAPSPCIRRTPRTRGQATATSSASLAASSLTSLPSSRSAGGEGGGCMDASLALRVPCLVSQDASCIACFATDSKGAGAGGQDRNVNNMELRSGDGNSPKDGDVNEPDRWGMARGCRASGAVPLALCCLY